VDRVRSRARQHIAGAATATDDGDAATTATAATADDASAATTAADAAAADAGAATDDAGASDHGGVHPDRTTGHHLDCADDLDRGADDHGAADNDSCADHDSGAARARPVGGRSHRQRRL
jgi:hypothetical protein